MPTVNPSSRGDERLRGELKQLRKDIEQLRRLVTRPESTAVLVQVTAEENLSWPVGTAWLDTSGE